jgi:hypothetical protein
MRTRPLLVRSLHAYAMSTFTIPMVLLMSHVRPVALHVQLATEPQILSALLATTRMLLRQVRSRRDCAIQISTTLMERPGLLVRHAAHHARRAPELQTHNEQHVMTPTLSLLHPRGSVCVAQTSMIQMGLLE